jgi:ABC-type branched-subunit amino acid transport system substrate-binding protein
MRKTRSAVVLAVLSLAMVAASCGNKSNSSTSTTATTTPGSTVTPSMTAEQTSCPSATSCFVSGNVSSVGGGVPGLFKGAQVGADAYLAYQNSLGGLDGRKFKLLTGDDFLSCSSNESLTSSQLSQVIAFTGSFALNDNCGGQVLAKNPTVPDVSVTLDPTTAALPNVFSVQPLAQGMAEGPLKYFKSKYPSAVTKVGSLYANLGSAPAQWAGQKAAMVNQGYKIIYEKPFPPTETDFTSEVIAMENAGVQMVVLSAINDSYGATLLKDMNQQGFKPQVIWGGSSTYSGPSASDPTVVKDAGGASVVNGYYLEQAQALYLGEDAKLVPADTTFLTWVQGLYPNFNIDLYTLYGWTSAELYVDALKKAGSNPTQASLLTALKGETSFNGDNLLAPANPAGKVPASCYVLAQVASGQFQRVDMPSGSVYRCDAPYLSGS